MNISSAFWRFIVCGGLVSITGCGGTAVTEESSTGGTAGSGGTGGSGGTAGTGGTAGSGGTGGTGGTAGSGGTAGMGGTAGTGGMAGTGGTAGMGGTAGAGGTGPACPPAPSCNWCGGATLYDGQGCVVGYKCANGVDPCSTNPCNYDPTACAPGAVCMPDDLCWPTSCDGTCTGVFPEPCSCTWTCNDGNSYAATCDPGSAGYGCACIVNGVETGTCYTASGDFTCGIPMCCGSTE